MQCADTPPVAQSSPLPETAPLVRLTAGLGTAGQKTWNLRRPVTLIGSRRPAHIVLHNPGIDKAHCVIVNTAATVLLRDLNTEAGCRVNGKQAKPIVELKNGDVITVGQTEMTIGIEMPAGAKQPSRTAKRRDETRLKEPLFVCQDGADAVWRVDEAVAVIGRHEDAAIRLEHPNVSTRHAVLFTCDGQPAVFDTGSRNGVWVSGERCTFAPLGETDRALIGPFALLVTASEEAARRKDEGHRSARSSNGAAASTAGTQRDSEGLLRSPFAIWQQTTHAGPTGPIPAHATNDWKELVTSLKHAANESWERLQVLPSVDGSADAIARPTGTQEAAASTGVVDDPATMLQEREAELARREARLQERERALTQKWTQLLSTRCPNCGRPVATPGTDVDA